MFSEFFSEPGIFLGKLSQPSHQLMVGGTQSCLCPPSFFQALPVVADVAVVVVAAVAVGGGEVVRHAYVAPATTATLELAAWMDNGYDQSSLMPIFLLSVNSLS